MIEELRNATGKLHKELEQKMWSDKIMDGSLTPDELNDLLRVNYCLFKAIEDMEIEHEELNYFIPKRVNVIEQDIIQNRQQIPVNQPTLDIDKTCKSSLVGMTYVALGSALGGSMINKQLLRNQQLQNKSFEFYGGSVNYVKLWKEFIHFIEKDEELTPETACSAAVKTFNYLIQIVQST